MRFVGVSLRTGTVKFFGFHWLSIRMFGPAVARNDRPIVYWFHIIAASLNVVAVLFAGLLFSAFIAIHIFEAL